MGPPHCLNQVIMKQARAISKGEICYSGSLKKSTKHVFRRYLKNDSDSYDISTALLITFHYLSILPSLFTKSNRLYVLFFGYP